MKITIHHDQHHLQADLNQPIDISIPLEEGLETVNCFYAPPMEVSPVVVGDFVGSTAEGGLVNFMNVKLNPHGNGTHTECVGHISKEKYTLNQLLKTFHFIARLVTVIPTKQENGDRVITKKQLEDVFSTGDGAAIVIRTMPNDKWKLKTNYSGANPPYIHHEAIQYLVDCGVEHLLIDLPSVDREQDEGKLLGHKAFWQYPKAVRIGATISELIYVPNTIKDGLYLLNIQIASFEIDVSPSKPVLYELKAAISDATNELIPQRATAS